MTPNSPPFENNRLEAARLFAHTMIVIDDQASQQELGGTTEEVHALQRPGRRAARAATERPNEQNRDILHSLNAKALIDNAMELGLVCSVLRPKQDEDLRARVRKAAERADIVCLDWEIYNDDGETAKALISEIFRSDVERNGRLRLIAIYTGERDRQKILNNVLSIFSDDERRKYGIKKNQNAEVINRHGLRIIYLFKKHGTLLPEDLLDCQVGEEQLPERLQQEFAQLSEGILSNVALATIASIRHVAHHVVGKFNGRMDGPYFHHRATIPSPDDAESYAVEIVLSELKNAVDKHQVAEQYAGRHAIEARIQHIAGERDKLRLLYEDSKGPKHGDLDISDVVKLIVDGCESAYEGISSPTRPPKSRTKENFSSLFADGLNDAKRNMREFASLTGIRAHPGNYLLTSGEYFPVLGLGSIVLDDAKRYWLCLQASCDAVRLTEDTAFLFVPLCVSEDHTKPDLVVPILNDEAEVEFQGLNLEKIAYSKAISESFTPDSETRTVRAAKIRQRKGFYFKTVNLKTGKRSKYKYYLWVADLKHRRALRIAQRLGQDMGRLGFDEFEPFRQ